MGYSSVIRSRFKYPTFGFLTSFIFAAVYWLWIAGWAPKLDSLGTLYDAQWWQIQRLLELKVDLGEHGLGGDAMFNWKGETIAYWLPFPGLVRFLLSIIFLLPNFIFEVFFNFSIVKETTYFSSISMALSYFLCLYFTYRIFMIFQQSRLKTSLCRKKTEKQTILVLFLLNPYWLLFPSTAVYFESISWAITLSVILIYFFLKFYTTKQNKFLAVYSLVLFLIFFTRVVEIIFASFLTCALIALQVREKIITNRKFTPYLASFLLGPIFLGLLNKLRWNSWTTLVPLENHIATQSSSARLAAAQNYGNFEPQRFLANFDYYLLPDINSFSSKFPFVQLVGTRFNDSMVTMDYVEQKLTIWFFFPLVVILSLASFFWGVRHYSRSNPQEKRLFFAFTVITISAGIGISTLLFAPALALRYIADWYLLFIPFCVLFFAKLFLKIENTIEENKYFLILNGLTIAAVLQFTSYFIFSHVYFKW
jgi:hypothetical protein